ncbi:MAG: ArnT family glycosyltransferase [Polyangiales bacterium]
MFSNAVRRLYSSARRRPALALAFALSIAHVLVMLVTQARTLGWGLTMAEQHHWRQGFTYGVAWNFAHTSWDFFHPRMFLYVSGSNIVGMEAPLYPYICAPFFRLFGDSIFACRIVTWLALIVVLVTVSVGFFPHRPWAKAGFLVAAGLTPLVWSEFRQVQPDGLMVAFACASSAFLVRWARRERTRDLILGASLATLALLTKTAAIGILPALWLFAVWGSRRRTELRFLARTTLAFVPAIAVSVAWDRWAVHLLNTYSKGVVVISVQHEPSSMLANLKNIGIARELVTFFAANYACSWWLLPAVFVGLVNALSTRENRAIGVPTLVWLAVVTVMLLCFGDRLHSNWYYTIPLFPPLAVFAGQGLATAAEALEGAPLDHNRRFALFVLVPGLFLGHLLARPLAGSIDPSHLAVHANQPVWSDDLGFATMGLLLCSSAGIATTGASRRLPPVLAAGAVLLMVTATNLPRRAAAQTLAFFSGDPERRHEVADLALLRKAVERHSSPHERVVTDDTEIVSLALIRRNGWNDGNKIAQPVLDEHVEKGARLFVHFGKDAPAPTVAKRKVLARGARWAIYCLAKDDCP